MSMFSRMKSAVSNVVSKAVGLIIQIDRAVVGPDVPLNIPAGTYTATLTTDYWDAYGREWATSMSRVTGGGPFGIRVWQRENDRSPWRQIIFMQDHHGQLLMIRGQLWFVYNKPNYGGSGRMRILSYRATRTTADVAQDADITV